MYAGSKLKKLRQELGLSQAQIAVELGLSQPYYSAIESGKKKITPALIKKIEEKWKNFAGWFGKFNTQKMGGENGGIMGVQSFDDDQKDIPTLKEIKAAVRLMETSKEYKIAENIKSQMFIRYSKEIGMLIPALNNYWNLLSKLLAFIHQYDKYLLPGITSDLYFKLRDGISETAISSDIQKVFSQIEELQIQINELSVNLKNVLEKLSSLDINNQIDRDIIKEYNDAVHNQEFEKSAAIREILNLKSREYPNI